MILIKKYPNRRLYDTSKSQYINLEVIKKLVMLHKEFKVVDSKTELDLTKSILLQIITEQESDDQQAVLTQTVLKQLIRFYGTDMRDHMRRYLEQSIEVFIASQDAMQNVMPEFLDNAPLASVFNPVGEGNVSLGSDITKDGSGVDPSTGELMPSSAPKPDSHLD